jgi:hypothetical protein
MWKLMRGERESVEVNRNPATSPRRNGSGERIQWRIQGLGEFACGVNLNNFAHKLLMKLFIIPPHVISPSHNLVTAILPSKIGNL